jgi:MFS transporter, PPP family, 3-phenylpropionic acid transporter
MGRRIQRSAWPRHSCPSFIVADEIEVLFLIEPWLLSVLTPAGAIASPHWQVLPVAGGGFDRGLAALTLTQPLHGITFAPACMRLLVANVPSQFAATAQALYGTVGVGKGDYTRMGPAAFAFLSVLCRRMPKLQGSSTNFDEPGNWKGRSH